MIDVGSLEDIIIEWLLEEEKKYRDGIHLTQLLRCKKRMELFYEKLATDRRFALALWRGRLLHHTIEEIIRQREPDCQIESKECGHIEINGDQIPVSYTPDVMTPTRVYEIKSVRRLRYNRDRRESVPYLHDTDQLMCYLLLSGRDDGTLIYYELTQNRFQVFNYTLNDLISPTYEKLLRNRVEEYLDEKTVYNPCYEFECVYCWIKQDCPRYKYALERGERIWAR